MDNSNNNEIENNSSDVVIQDPFNINSETSNNLINNVPEEIKNSQLMTSNSSETFDLLNSENVPQEGEQTPFAPDVDYEIAPEEIAPPSQINEAPSPLNQENENPNEQVVSPNVTELVEKPKIDPNILERLSIIYMGEKYEKFKKLINVPAGLFTYFYAFYRKMYLLGFILMILEIIIGIAFKNILFTLILNVIMFFGFNILYVLKVKFKVTRIKNKKKNKDKHPNEIADECAIAGGTSIGMVFISFILSIIVGFILAFLFALVGIFNMTFGTDIHSIKDIPTVLKDLYGDLTSDYIGSSDGVYRGKLVSNYDEDITKVFTIKVPIVFSNSTTTLHTYEYDYLINQTGSSACNITFNQPRGFDNGEELINKIKDYDNNHNLKTTEVEEANINNITWTTFTSSSDKEDIFYYGTTKNSKAYIFKFTASKEKNECLAYKDTIMSSIKETN